MSIASALFSDSQIRLFGHLFGQPERGLHLSELRRLTGLGSASLQRELKRLVDAGLVNAEKLGNLRRFQANQDSPVYGELVAIVRKTMGAQMEIRDALMPLTPQLHGAWIYGSFAKQTDTAASDIDIMLVGEALRLGDVLALLLPLETTLGRKINPSCYTRSEFETRLAEPDSFVNRVLAQPILPLIGKIDASIRTG